MSPAYVWTAVLLGLLAGWLVNYLADVLPLTRRFSHPLCVACGENVTWKDYLLFRPCASCGRRRSARAWVVMAFYLASAVFLWLRPPDAGHFGFWVGLPLLVFFGVVVVIDLEHRVVLNQVALAGVAIGALLGVWLNGGQKGDWLTGLLSTLGGGALGFGIMLLLYYLGWLYAKRLAKKSGATVEEGDALGFGDVNLTGVLGLMLGYPVILAGLVFGIIIGGLVSLVYMLVLKLARKYTPLTAIPYAPFLVLGAAIILFIF